MSNDAVLKEALEQALRRLGKTDVNIIWKFLLHSAREHYKPETGEIALVPFKDSVEEAVANIEARMKGLVPKGLDVGFPMLNSILGYLQKDNYIVIGARPSVGKTSFKIILQDNILINNDSDRVAIAMIDLNYEMANYQSATKFISRHAGLTYGELMSKDRTLTNEQFEKVLRAKKRIENFTIFGIDIPQKVSDMESKIIDFAGKFHEENKDKDEVYVVVSTDHTLLSRKEGRQSNMELVEAVSKSNYYIKKVAHTTNIVLSQLKDESIKEDRAKYQFDPRPGDLAWSQQLEQDAETILLLHNPSVLMMKEYQVDGIKYPTKYKDENGEICSLLSVYIAKNRYGERDKRVLFSEYFKRNDVRELADPVPYFNSIGKTIMRPPIG